MANFNKVLFMGNLTRDPELRYLPNGTAVTSFTVASNRVYTLQTGEKKQEVAFMRVIVWARRAETCGEYLSKGSSVFVEGRLQTRTWEAQDGQKRSAVEIVADNVQFLGRPRKEGQPVTAEGSKNGQQPLDIVPDIDLPPSGTLPPGNTAKGDTQGRDEVPF
ncbi:MAG: single-stranded DNA-binding protein [Candidatus Omnitrophica bacterium]|nr:single-stranded DNA-binding protein [Candidatus Omnitrophota bacterium]